MQRFLIVTTVVVAVVVAGVVALIPRGDSETEKKESTAKRTVPSPIPTPRPVALQLRDMLYAELSLEECCQMLGGDLEKALQPQLQEKNYADARDLLESEATRTLHSDSPVYWATLARVRNELGDPIGTGDAAQKSNELAQNDSRLEYATLRLLEDLAQEVDEDAARVLGVICEIGYDEGLVVIAGFEDGQSRLFFGTGGGVISDTTKHPEVANAARQLVTTARPFARSADVRRDRPLPMRGEVRFVMLTPGGPRVLTESKAELAAGSTGTPLYRAMHGLLTPLRELMQSAATGGSR